MTTTDHPRPGIETYTGKRFDSHNPRIGDVCIEDIAHALACINRFGGHAQKPYSVAQHCYLASKMAPSDLEFQALMHDAHEAYVLDMPGPFKAGLPDYRAMEEKVQAVVRRAFGLPLVFDPRVKEVDLRMMVTEAKALGLTWWDKYPGVSPYAELEGMEPWPWHKAKQRFLDRFVSFHG